jgi:hypothetical protein
MIFKGCRTVLIIRDDELARSVLIIRDDELAKETRRLITLHPLRFIRNDACFSHSLVISVIVGLDQFKH